MFISSIARFFATLVFLLHFVASANSQTISVKEISLIKIIIPEKFTTDYDLLVKIGDLYSKSMNSETAKALDEAFSGFFAKLDDVTAKSILYLIRKNPEKNALKRLLKERDNYCFWHPLVSGDIDEYYANLIMLADSLDEEGDVKHGANRRPKYPKYDTLSTHLVYLDRKILLEKNLFWNSQPPEFHQLTALESRLKILPDEIKRATENVEYHDRDYKKQRNYSDDPPKPEVLIEAEKKLTQLRTENDEKEILLQKKSAEIGVNKQAEYITVMTLLADSNLTKLPDLILKLRL